MLSFQTLGRLAIYTFTSFPLSCSYLKHFFESDICPLLKSNYIIMQLIMKGIKVKLKHNEIFLWSVWAIVLINTNFILTKQSKKLLLTNVFIVLKESSNISRCCFFRCLANIPNPPTDTPLLARSKCLKERFQRFK